MYKKRILHISKFFYPYYGGIEDVVYTIIKGLKSQYEQQVICFSEHMHTSVEIIDEIPVTRVAIIGKLFSQPIPLGYKRQLNKVIRLFRPDFIHVHLPNPWVCACLLHTDLGNAKLFVHWHADILGKNILYPLVRPLEQGILQKANRIIATSREYVTLSVPLQRYTDKITILPNTVNEHKLGISPEDDIEIQRIRQQYGGRKIILFIGRHVEYKGISYLIQCADLLNKDAVVLIAGTGVLTPQLTVMAHKYNNVFLIGRIPNEQIKFYLYAASIFAFPSIDRREAFGVALAEALYCGIPAVSFHIDGSGTTFVNQHKLTGFVVPNRDVKAYAEAINTLLDDDILHKQYSDAAKQWTRDHFLCNQVQILNQVYESC